MRAAQSGLCATDKILDVCLGGYGRAYARARKNLRGEEWLDWGARKEMRREGPSSAERERFYKILSYCKKEGLIEKRKDKKEWELTKKGLVELEGLEERKASARSFSSYTSAGDTILRIVIFDVPEKEREKRAWIRGGLLALGFEMCQKSVWMGKRKIPKRFLEDLRDKEALQFVHIFEVAKKGSLNTILK